MTTVIRSRRLKRRMVSMPGQPVRRRVAAFITLVMLAPVMYAAAACNGWSPSAAGRMACCQAAGGHCAAISPDDCCGDSEQRRNLETVAVPLPSPGAGVDEAVVAAGSHRPASLAHRASLGRPATYLLDSVFLI